MVSEPERVRPARVLGVAVGGANEIERRFRREHPLRDAMGGYWIVWIGLPVIVGLAVGSTVYATETTGTAITFAVLAMLVVGFGMRLWVAWRARRPEERLLREAALVRERVRYSSTRREASEFGAEGGRGVVGRVRTSRERELTERPATLSLLVNDFRALAAEAGEVARRVVIAS